MICDNAELLPANPAYIPFELCTLVTRAISSLKSAQRNITLETNKRGAGVSDEEEGILSTSSTPLKTVFKKGKSKAKKQKSIPVERINENDEILDAEATEEEMDVDEQPVLEVDHTAVEYL